MALPGSLDAVPELATSLPVSGDHFTRVEIVIAPARAESAPVNAPFA